MIGEHGDRSPICVLAFGEFVELAQKAGVIPTPLLVAEDENGPPPEQSHGPNPIHEGGQAIDLGHVARHLRRIDRRWPTSGQLLDRIYDVGDRRARMRKAIDALAPSGLHAALAEPTPQPSDRPAAEGSTNLRTP